MLCEADPRYRSTKIDCPVKRRGTPSFRNSVSSPISQANAFLVNPGLRRWPTWSMQLTYPPKSWLYLIWNGPSLLLVYMQTIIVFLFFARTRVCSLLVNFPFMAGVQVRVVGMYVSRVQDSMYVVECLFM